MLLFYKNANRIWPVAPGVLYSLNGQNPNEIDTETMDYAKPVLRIRDNWYVSRNLGLRGPRLGLSGFFPKPLMDHSTRVRGGNVVREAADEEIAAE